MSTAIPKILVTGFEPFAGASVNPAQAIALALDGERITGHRIVGAVLPTEFAQSLPRLKALIRKHRPVLVLALGQAGGREGISLERVAINLIDARIPDNAGDQPVDISVVDNAPNAYFSTLPIKAMLARLTGAGITASISHTAGTFVCNQVFYGLMRLLARRRHTRGGFVHVPYLPEQADGQPGSPSMSLESMLEAIRLCVEVAVDCVDDLHYAAGDTH